MPRILYLKDRLTIHDDRFKKALVDAGHDVVSACVDASTVLDAIVSAGADVVHAGPLRTAALAFPHLRRAPLVSVCWGSDGLGKLSPGEIRALRASAVVITDCRMIARRLESVGAAADAIVAFPWGIDLELFVPPAVQSGSTRPPWFVTTRSFEPLYRQDVVLRGFARAFGSGSEATLTMFGAGSELSDLQQLTRSLQIVDRVEFRAPIPEEEVADVFRSATAWVNAAISDGICISLLQALACGCSVITTDLPCAREAAGVAPASFFPLADDAALASLMQAAGRPSIDDVASARRRLEGYADWKQNSQTYVSSVERALA